MADPQAWRRFIPDMPVPDFCSAGMLAVNALHALRPAERMTVPEWAERSRWMATNRANGLWKNSFAPYMIEPSRMRTSRRFRACVFVGPARTAKSESLVLNTIGHGIECQPSDMLIVCQTQQGAKDFSEKKLGPLLRANRGLTARQMSGRGSDNIHEKKFQGNMHLAIGWPVIGFFSANEWQTVILTDRDRYQTDDIDGEGAPLILALKRTTHAGSLGMVISESSPGRPIIADEDWRPSTPHEAPPCSGGILSEYNLGTRGAFYWRCPHCEELFRPEFETLRWDDLGTPGESAKTVWMQCQHGCVIEPRHKHACNQGGLWLHETKDGGLCEIDDVDIRDTDIASWRLEGPVAAMQSWEQLVSLYLQARQTFDTTGDDTLLKSTINLDQGKAYRPAVRSIGDSLSEDTLKALAEPYAFKVAPAETRFVTWQFDIQGNRFVGQADAWGPGLERWLIDRIEIAMPPELAPGGQRDAKGHAARAIDPARYIEDWAVLPPLLSTVYPVAGTGFGIMPAAMIIDSAGRPGVTPNAYKFLRQMQQKGLGQRVYLAKGSPTLQDRARYTEPEKVLQQRGKKIRDIRLVFVGTGKVKDEIVLALTRQEHGPGKYHLPKDAPAAVFSEMTAEHLTDKGWDKKRPGIANEAFDLAAYGKALTIILGAEKFDWEKAPVWAQPIESNAFAVRLESGPEKQLVHAIAAKARRVRSQVL